MFRRFFDTLFQTGTGCNGSDGGHGELHAVTIWWILSHTHTQGQHTPPQCTERGKRTDRLWRTTFDPCTIHLLACPGALGRWDTFQGLYIYIFLYIYNIYIYQHVTLGFGRVYIYIYIYIYIYRSIYLSVDLPRYMYIDLYIWKRERERERGDRLSMHVLQHVVQILWGKIKCRRTISVFPMCLRMVHRMSRKHGLPPYSKAFSNDRFCQ